MPGSVANDPIFVYDFIWYEHVVAHASCISCELRYFRVSLGIVTCLDFFSRLDRDGLFETVSIDPSAPVELSCYLDS
jgi:hypothetical protein